eukprot:s61_g10.t1
MGHDLLWVTDSFALGRATRPPAGLAFCGKEGDVEAILAGRLRFKAMQKTRQSWTWMSLKPRIDGTVTQMNLAQNMVHLLQLLIPGGLATDEPVRIYMRSVQQAPDIAITFVGYLNAVRHVMAAVELEAEEVKTDRARTAG